MPEQDIKQTVTNAIETVTKDLPQAVKDNKGAVIGAAIGYFLGDTLKKNESVLTGVLGAVVGHIVDEKGKK